MENENIIVKKTLNMDLIYSFAFVVLAWTIALYGASAPSLFDPSVHPFMVRPYVGLLYFLSRLGFQADPVLFIFAYGLPFLFSATAIYLSVRVGKETPMTNEGERKFFWISTE